MPFKNIDLDVDIEICLFEILIPVLILKKLWILILILVLILEKLEQYFLDFHGIFTGVTQSLQNKFYHIIFTILLKP